MNRSIYSHLEAALGSDQIITVDGNPVVSPRDISVLAEAVRMIAADRHSVIITGGGTSPSGTVPEGPVPVSLTGLAGVREVNPGDSLLVAGAGTVSDEAVDAACKERLLLPLDITSGDRATVGGVYMTDAISPWSAGYGPFRDYVLGAKCVTARGEVVTFGGRTMKNVTGYEITRFLVGTRGLFAIAAELILKTLPLPERQIMVVGRFVGGGDSFAAAAGVGAAGNVVKRCELDAPAGCGGEILLGVGIEGMDPLVRKGAVAVREIMDRAGAESVSEESPEAFTVIRRESARRLTEAGLATLQAPPSASSALLEGLKAAFPDMPVLAHPLIGRVHVAAGAGDLPTLSELALAVGGKMPTDWSRALREGLNGMFTPRELKIARALKRELDPDGVLNPHLRLD